MLLSLRKLLPKSISTRFFLILIAPVVLSQIVFVYVFFGRHTETVVKCISNTLAGDIKTLSTLLDKNNEQCKEIANNMDMDIAILPNSTLRKTEIARHGRIKKHMRKALEAKGVKNFFIKSARKKVFVYVGSSSGNSVYKISFLRKKIYSRTTPIVILWGASSAIILLIVAFLFLKNQIRPIKRLAMAMYSFGKGKDDNKYKPEGATEIRMAGLAFCEMKTNFRKLLSNRMNTLAGISHDLKTPITRMKLQLAMMPKTSETNGLLEDVSMMTKITDDFLFHARQESQESFSYQNLYIFLSKAIKNHEFPIKIEGDKAIEICIKQTSFKRIIDNIVSNSEKYAKNLYISFYKDKGNDVVIDFEDDGAGINPLIIGDIFHPFFTENEARTKTSYGHYNMGLGLSIVKDIVNDHGGTITAFCNSKKHGGARFTMVIPNGEVN